MDPDSIEAWGCEFGKGFPDMRGGFAKSSATAGTVTVDAYNQCAKLDLSAGMMSIKGPNGF